MYQIKGYENIAKLNGQKVMFQYRGWEKPILAQVVVGKQVIKGLRDIFVSTYTNGVHVIYLEETEDGAIWCSNVDSRNSSVYLLVTNKGK